MGSMNWCSLKHVQHLVLLVLAVKAELSRFVGIFMVATNLLTVVVSLAFFGDQARGLGERGHCNKPRIESFPIFSKQFIAFDAGDCFLEFFWICMLHLGRHLASKSMVPGLQRERSIEIH